MPAFSEEAWEERRTNKSKKGTRTVGGRSRGSWCLEAPREGRAGGRTRRRPWQAWSYCSSSIMAIFVDLGWDYFDFLFQKLTVYILRSNFYDLFLTDFGISLQIIENFLSYVTDFSLVC
jgi:hypothetical protein